MTRGPWFLESFAGSWRFEEVSEGETRVGFRYSLRARPAWICWLITPVLAWRFGRHTSQRLAALKAAVEDGKLRGRRKVGL